MYFITKYQTISNFLNMLHFLILKMYLCRYFLTSFETIRLFRFLNEYLTKIKRLSESISNVITQVPEKRDGVDKQRAGRISGFITYFTLECRVEFDKQLILHVNGSGIRCTHGAFAPRRIATPVTETLNNITFDAPLLLYFIFSRSHDGSCGGT